MGRVLILAGLAVFLAVGGCASAPPEENYAACIDSIQPPPAESIYRDSRDAALVIMAQALAGPGSTPQRDCGRVHEAYYAAHANIAQSVGSVLKLPLSSVAGGWAAGQVLGNIPVAGDTTLNIDGEGNQTAGRNVLDRGTTVSDSGNTVDADVETPE